MIKINGENKNLNRINLLEYLQKEGFQVTKIAVELNGEIIKKIDFENTFLQDGDSVEIVSFVGGGWYGKGYCYHFKRKENCR